MQKEPMFPMELTKDVPRITLVGDSWLQIEQHRGLVAYQQEEIILLSGSGQVKIQGKDMQFKQYTSSEAIVCGVIISIQFLEAGR